MNAPSTRATDHPYRSAPTPPRSIVQRFSLVGVGGVSVLAGIAILCAGEEGGGRWWALPVLLAAAWLVRWHVRRKRRAVSLRIDDDGALFVREAGGERALAWNQVTRMNVSLTNSLYVAGIGIAAVIAPFRVMMEPSTEGSLHRLLAVFFICGGVAAICGSEAYGRFFWLPIFLGPNRLSLWFSRAELDALSEAAKSRATESPPTHRPPTYARPS